MSAQTLDTGTEELLAEVDEGVAVVTLNRPEVRNALGDTISPALRRTIRTVGEMSEVRCVVVTGAGTAFCSGGDIKGMGGSRPRPDAPTTREAVIADQAERQRSLTGALYALPQPTIAALPGPAAGAGLSIALACDLRIAADSAFVTTGFANVGLPGDYGASFFLTQLVGTSRARELFFTAERVDAQRCLDLGIVNRVVPAAQLMDETLTLAHQLAAGPPIAYRLMKENLDHALRSDLSTCLGHEAAATVTAGGSEDHREAVRAFVEKRRPRFNGR
jgi:enoyl-CoA hydratase/carnithine racemase